MKMSISKCNTEPQNEILFFSDILKNPGLYQRCNVDGKPIFETWALIVIPPQSDDIGASNSVFLMDFKENRLEGLCDEKFWASNMYVELKNCQINISINV